MRVLHLVNNWKLTGEVAPALELAGALAARGHTVHAAVGRPLEPAGGPAGDHARRVGVPVVGGLALSKHFRFLDNFRDARRLRRIMAETRYEVLHVHGTNGHLLAAAARRPAGSMAIVRNFYAGDVARLRRRDRLLTARAADAVVVPSASEEAWARQLRPDLDRAVVRLPGPVDLERFDRARLPPPEPRPGVFRVGVVARVQTHRRWGDILEALRRLRGVVPEVHLVVVGRGTHYTKLLVEPVRDLGLEDRVELAGYLAGEAYVAKLATLDAALFLVPGSDGTCRAARELMALGLPLVVARTGMLPELVEEGRSGLLPDGPGAGPLAAAIHRLAGDPELRARLGHAARTRAERDFDLRKYAATVEALYERTRDRQEG